MNEIHDVHTGLRHTSELRAALVKLLHPEATAGVVVARGSGSSASGASRAGRRARGTTLGRASYKYE